MAEPSILSKHTPKEIGLWTFMTIKSEIVLYDLRQSLFWQSLMELGLIAAALILLLLQGKFRIILHVLHLGRPVIAYMMIQTLPRLQVIYNYLPEDLEGSNALFQDKIFEQVKRCSRFISYYIIITAGAAVLDVLGLIADIVGLGGEDNSVIFYTAVAWLFLAFDLYIFLWFFSLKLNFPHDTWLALVNIARGNLQEAYKLATSVTIKRN